MRIQIMIGLGCVFGAVGNLWAMPKPWAPSIEVGAKTISVAPAKIHPSPSNPTLEIKESEECEAKVQSARLIQFSEACDFLRGIYYYTVKLDGVDELYKVYTEFLIHQKNPKSRSILIHSPVIFPAKS